ncbi:MAG: hypothetical protein HOP16_12265 [Acidobacteria bacterium]|nr:hypothetical protein [Acidobacteriota bacterium]
MKKRVTTRKSKLQAVEVVDPAATSEPGPQIDLNALMVEVDLEKLVLGLKDLPSSNEDDETPASAVVTEIAPVERRSATRLSGSEVGDRVQVSLPRAAKTGLVNVSELGVLIETNCQLFPGRTTDVFVKLRGERLALRATVVRSSIHALTSEGLIYRSALQFEQIITLADLGR